MKSSEFIKELICMAFDRGNAKKTVSLDLAMRIYEHILKEELEEQGADNEQTNEP